MLRGPRVILAKPCKLCAFEMKEFRWRCFDCNVDLCEPCSLKSSSPHRFVASCWQLQLVLCSGHLIVRDPVDALRPVCEALIRNTIKKSLSRFKTRPLFGLSPRTKCTALLRSCFFILTNCVILQLRSPTVFQTVVRRIAGLRMSMWLNESNASQLVRLCLLHSVLLLSRMSDCTL